MTMLSDEKIKEALNKRMINLERVKKDDLKKEVTNDDIANMLQRIHHENRFIINAIYQMARVNNADVDRLLNDWDEDFKKAKGE